MDHTISYKKNGIFLENYTKGKNVEEELDRSSIPIKNLPVDFVWMHVKPGSKMKNLLGFALKSLKEQQKRSVVWSGAGPSLAKAISCAEILKRRNKGMHQITKVCYKKVDEYWVPKVEGLDDLKVERKIPAIHILLSKDPLDPQEPGYQPPGSFDALWKSQMKEEKQRLPGRSRPRATSDQYSPAVLQYGKRAEQKRRKNMDNHKEKGFAPADTSQEKTDMEMA